MKQDHMLMFGLLFVVFLLMNSKKETPKMAPEPIPQTVPVQVTETKPFPKELFIAGIICLVLFVGIVMYVVLNKTNRGNRALGKMGAMLSLLNMRRRPQYAGSVASGMPERVLDLSSLEYKPPMSEWSSPGVKHYGRALDLSSLEHHVSNSAAPLSGPVSVPPSPASAPGDNLYTQKLEEVVGDLQDRLDDANDRIAVQNEINNTASDSMKNFNELVQLIQEAHEMGAEINDREKASIKHARSHYEHLIPYMKAVIADKGLRTQIAKSLVAPPGKPGLRHLPSQMILQRYLRTLAQ